MQEPQRSSDFNSQPHADPWREKSLWPFRIGIGLVVAAAAVGIPALSLHLDDVYHETLVMLEDAREETETVEEIEQNVQSPAAVQQTVEKAFTPRERRQIQQDLGFGKDTPPEVVERKIASYAADVQKGRYDRVPEKVKAVAIQRIGVDKLRALKQKLMRMNLSRDQMIEYAKRELKKYQ